MESWPKPNEGKILTPEDAREIHLQRMENKAFTPIAKKLGRSAHSIEIYTWKLTTEYGTDKKKNRGRGGNQVCYDFTYPGDNSGKGWSSYEEHWLLIRRALRISFHNIGKELGRSAEAVKEHLVRMLKLKRQTLFDIPIQYTCPEDTIKEMKKAVREAIKTLTDDLTKALDLEGE